jgi:microcystin-dependent protein
MSTLIENGFQSGIAISEQFNRLLAQGAAAGYAVGQYIVDQLQIDADPLDAESLALNFKQAMTFLPLAGGTMTGSILFSTVSGTAGRTLIQGGMADTDSFRIRISGTAADAGLAEIATSGDGNEPIYIRQYGGVFNTLVRSLTLLDASGNSAFPGTVSAPSGFVGDLTGKATSAGTADTAIKAQQDRNGKVIDQTYSPILVGELKWYAGRTVPNGYLLCDGRPVSRTTYAKLFEAIGTIYGSGDGATTFNLPNGNGRTLQGGSTSEVGTYRNAGLPPITHTHSGTTESAGSHTHTRGSMEITGTFSGAGQSGSLTPPVSSGAFYIARAAGGVKVANSEGEKDDLFGFKASNAWTGSTSSSGDHTHSFTTGNNSGVNAIYGTSSTVQPPAMIGMLIIKY